VRRISKSVQWTVFLTNAHKPHEPWDAFLIHQMAFVAQMPGHLADAVERRLQELFADLAHQAQGQGGLAFGLIVI
jgi:hypothetical protein